MAGIFDIFTNQNAQDAANAQIGGLQGGYQLASGSLGTGINALQGGYRSSNSKAPGSSASANGSKPKTVQSAPESTGIACSVRHLPQLADGIAKALAVAIARGLMARPKLLMIDEPFLGLAPMMVQEIGALLRRIREEQGISIVFIEQNVELALRLADRGYVLESGRSILDGVSAELLQSAEVKRIFLGDFAF